MKQSLIDILSEKVAGSVNELTPIERAYFETEFHGKYTIIGPIGRTGAHSSAYLLHDTNENEFVLKIPANKKGTSWITSQLKGENAKEECSESYVGNIVVPRPIMIGEHYIIEPYAGVELTAKLYDSLPLQEKTQIAKDMADFLNFIHQKQPGKKLAPLGICKDSPKYTMKKIQEFQNQFQSPIEQKKWAKNITGFQNRDTSDEVSVLTHGDLRFQNVLYNPKTKKVAIIDFELSGNGNIYRDFVPVASFGMSYDLLKKMILFYNKIDKKTPLYINPKKVALLHKVSMYHEYGRCAILRNTPPDQYQSIAKRFNAETQNIENTFNPSVKINPNTR